MMMKFETVEETTRRIRRTFEQRKTYPHGNGYSWKEFLVSQEGKKGLFVLVMERDLAHQEVAFNPHRDKLFGLYSDRDDGKLGQMCFGWATPNFGGAKKAYETIFSVDGYDCEFLNTRDYTAEDLHLPAIHCKIVDVIDNQDTVAEEVAKLARQFISADVPTKEQAAVLADIVDTLWASLSQWKHPLIQNVAKEVMAKIGERWNTLEEENDDLRERIKENENEMDLLSGFASDPE